MRCAANAEVATSAVRLRLEENGEQPTSSFATTSSNHSSGVSSKILGKAFWTKLQGPIILFPQACNPFLIAAACPCGSCSAIQPNRQPGRRNRLDRPERVMMGTSEVRLARGVKGWVDQCMWPYISSAMIGVFLRWAREMSCCRWSGCMLLPQGLLGLVCGWLSRRISPWLTVRNAGCAYDQNKRCLFVNQALHLLNIALPIPLGQAVVEPDLAVLDTPQ